MKRFIFASLTTLVLSSAVIPSVKADPSAFNTYIPLGTPVANLTPFDLVSAAKQGQFTDQGIPSNGAFTTSYISGNFTAEDLIQAAIQANRLNAEMANDAGYLSSVTDQLRGINRLF